MPIAIALTNIERQCSVKTWERLAGNLEDLTNPATPKIESLLRASYDVEEREAPLLSAFEYLKSL